MFLVAVKCFSNKSDSSQLKQFIFGRHILSRKPNVPRIPNELLQVQIVNEKQTESEGQQTTNSQNEIIENALDDKTSAKENESISIFERILSTPKSSHLIKLIWDKFDLSKKPEILSLVSILNNHFWLQLLRVFLGIQVLRAKRVEVGGERWKMADGGDGEDGGREDEFHRNLKSFIRM